MTSKRRQFLIAYLACLSLSFAQGETFTQYLLSIS